MIARLLHLLKSRFEHSMSQHSLDLPQTQQFLAVLRKTKEQTRLRAFYPSGHPLKSSDSGRKGEPSLKVVQDWQEKGRGVYVVINDGGDNDSEITACRAVFCEWDDRPKDWQVEAWKELKLPEPTIQVDTGGKSIHNYWVFDEPISVEEWKSIQTRLLDHADADRSLKNPSRVMRLPGTRHIDASGNPGERCSIIHNSEKYYTSEQINRKLPSAEVHDKIVEANRHTNYKKRSMQQVKEALEKIPPRTPGTGTYHIYRNLFWGLIKACEESGSNCQEAITLMKSHSPSWQGLEQIASSGGEKVTAGTFWYWAIDFGWDPPAVTTVFEPGSIANVLGTDEIIASGEKPIKLEPKQLMQELRNAKKTFRYNVFTQQIEQEEIVVKGIERYYLRLAEHNIKISKDVAIDCLVEVAHENEYDPVTSYLNHCANTVKTPAYIDMLATTYLRPDDAANASGPTLYDDMLKKTLINAVRRAFEPGCKFDNACVLLGDQGARKSSFWKALGNHFFSDALKNIQSKDDLMVLHRSWIMEWAELDQITSKHHAGQIKAFLSQSTDMFRVPYGKATEAFPRRGIIVGSTNKDNFLVDETGNRRFWVIPITATIDNPIDIESLLKEVDAIWAAAVHAFKNNEPVALTVEQEKQVACQNDGYLAQHPWEATIVSWLKDPRNALQIITSELLLSDAIGKPVDRQGVGDTMKIGSILKKLGYVKRRKLINGTNKNIFKKP